MVKRYGIFVLFTEPDSAKENLLYTSSSFLFIYGTLLLLYLAVKKTCMKMNQGHMPSELDVIKHLAPENTGKRESSDDCVSPVKKQLSPNDTPEEIQALNDLKQGNLNAQLNAIEFVGNHKLKKRNPFAGNSAQQQQPRYIQRSGGQPGENRRSCCSGIICSHQLADSNQRLNSLTTPS